MKGTILIAMLAGFMSAFSALPSASPTISFHGLVVENERNPQRGFSAKQLADRLGLPRTVYLEQGVLIDALGIEDGKPVYAVITNFSHPFEGGVALFYEQVVRRFDVARGIINPRGAIITDQNWNSRSQRNSAMLNRNLLLVPDWTADKVMAFDPTTGDLVDTAFIHSNSVALASPKEARLSPRRTITVSDQITDLVQAFDSNGVYISYFAPAGGVNTSILDNIRGHAYRPNGRLLVTVASGANQNCIAEFDSAGNYLGQFIPPSSNGPNSPFAILFRSNDILITTSSAPIGVIRFDLSGNYLSLWAAITSFPQQIAAISRGRYAVANFSGTGQTGIRLYSADGTFLRLLSGVTGNRGVYELPSGNFLTTNGAGIHELDTNGTLVRTIAVGTNLQYINHVNFTPLTSVAPPTLPIATSLSQNYPNPFNPSTVIGYAVATAGKVRLSVYDMLGREIVVLVDAELQPGRYEALLSSSQLAEKFSSGVYLYQLVTRDAVLSRKLIMLK
jgi:hypothetical protein